MSVPFTEFRLIYPPHPALSWSPDDLPRLSAYVAQYKYDDWHVLLYFLPDGTLRFYTRKKELLPRYRPPTALLDSLRRLKLPGGRFHVLDGGLMHYKTPRVKNTLVLWDILVHSDQYLIGTTYPERYALLRTIARNPTEPVRLSYTHPVTHREVAPVIGLRIANHLWLAPLLQGDLRKSFKAVKPLPEIEGLVLKDPKARLQRPFRRDHNASWMIRVRKA